MSARVIVAGIVAGFILFLWGFLTHVVIPLGEVGVTMLPNDKQEKVFSVLKEQIAEPGLYFMPGMDKSLKGDEATAEMERFVKAYEAGPTGLMVYQPTGATPMSPKQLGVQAILDVLIGITAAFVVSFFRKTSFLCKVLLVMSFGLLAFLETDAAYMNWYRFPMDYSLAQLADKLGGMLVIGVVLAAMIRNPGPESLEAKT